ncbi:PREDICTED: cysteine proteinase inhibitor-like [Lupinus angustifolius]|uniref:cysteine proteinase inhibitor-like n=1 Tax=Lupinus angustifolius TaxID=3871 RepID=UPI00092F94A3|nr:PREDICTED: cysteine proteinase inhibitor-like [Lupinus angustifolius]XP_019434622.1 PREDICTED: cysteine proteinase inhibitor-like [Lupinus angustifolius]
MLGGVTVVEGSENSLEIQELALFAVQEHNKNQNTVVEFVKVISAKEQVVEGVLYYITLEAKDCESNKIYETKIWDRPWLKLKEVQEFKFVGDAPSASTT